jgi:chromate transporter
MLYFARVQHRAGVEALLYGIQPVIVAIVVFAAYQLGRSAFKQRVLVLVGIAGLLATLFTTIDTVWVILLGGLAGVALLLGARRANNAALLLPLGGAPALVPLLQAASEPSLWRLGLFFLKVGATLLGSGYVLVSYLQTGLVDDLGWLSQRQLTDSIAVGQMTPGPVFTTAAFVGYVLMAGAEHNVAQGVLGAIVCAVGIFLPSFIIVALMSPFIPRLRAWPTAGAFLDGVNAVVVGSIIATGIGMLREATLNLPDASALTLPLGQLALDLPALLLFALTLYILIRYPKFNSTWLIVAGALVGLAVRFAL